MKPSKQYKYSIDDVECGDIDDDGPWRGCTLSSEGNTLKELIDNAWISETDQDGGEGNGPYQLEDSDSTIQATCEVILKELVK